jgi:medium-chain acyl-[acyl-carrier-protein] hydrolase
VSDNKWVVTLRTGSSSPSTALICLPYAGGGPELFRTWSSLLDPSIELLALRLPGRGNRIKEPMYDEWEPLVEHAYSALSHHLRGPHAFYGHSFGARLAYELAHRAVVEHPSRTQRLFVSGCRSPNVGPGHPLMHRQPDPELIASLRGNCSAPAEVLDTPRLAALFLPTYRNDVRLAESWGDRHGHGLDLPMTALFGQDDEADGEAAMRDWSRYCTRDFELVGVPGGHLFLESHPQEVTEVVNTRVRAGNG